jgi:hypothetical protein
MVRSDDSGYTQNLATRFDNSHLSAFSQIFIDLGSISFKGSIPLRLLWTYTWIPTEPRSLICAFGQ